MPTTRRRRTRPLQPTVPAVHPDHVAYLLSGDPASARNPFALVHFSLCPSDAQARAVWEQIRAEELPRWIAAHPGRRPAGWWAFDAQEPRRRLGGVGTPRHEPPPLWFGVPPAGAWLTAFEVRYRRGEAVDVHGQPIGQGYADPSFAGVPVDLLNPPVYESQAAYLLRLGLMSDTEARGVPPEAFEPEVIAVEGCPELREVIEQDGWTH